MAGEDGAGEERLRTRAEEGEGGGGGQSGGRGRRREGGGEGEAVGGRGRVGGGGGEGVGPFLGRLIRGRDRSSGESVSGGGEKKPFLTAKLAYKEGTERL